MAERYTITETLRASGSIVLQRGFRSCDRRPILLKRPSSPSPSPEAVRQLNHEWAIVRALAPGRVLRPLALEPHARGALLVLEDFQGVPLRGLLGARMDIGRFLRIAVEVTAAAEEIHAHGVVHKAIRPDSLLVDFETAEVKLTDLGFASLLPRELAKVAEDRYQTARALRQDLKTCLADMRSPLVIGAYRDSSEVGPTHPMSLRASRNEIEVAAERGDAQRGAGDEVAQSEQRSPRPLEPGPGQSTAAVVARAEQLELMAVLQASQAISREIVLPRLLETLARTLVQQAGAQRGMLILARNDELRVTAEARSGPGEIQVVIEDRELSAAVVPMSVILHVRRSGERVLLHDASGRNLFSDDPYLAAASPASVLCLPILGRTEVAAVLYLEDERPAGSPAGALSPLQSGSSA